MTGIYKITNTINNKCYIGQSIDIENRWERHIYESKILRKKTKFYLALNKYGVDAFTFEVLEECPINQATLDERERYWVEYYDSYNNGYNSTLGGQSTSNQKYHPQEMRDLWDEGYSIGEIAEIIGCCTDTVDLRLKEYNNYNPHMGRSRGRQHSIEEGNCSAIPVYQYDLKGQYIAEYKSISEAARALGYDSVGGICAVLNRGQHTSYGYQWSKEKVESMPIIPVHGGKLVRCINTNKIFNSTEEAAKWCNLKDKKSIGRCCTGKRKTTGKHPETGEPLKWEYVE